MNDAGPAQLQHSQKGRHNLATVAVALKQKAKPGDSILPQAGDDFSGLPFHGIGFVLHELPKGRTRGRLPPLGAAADLCHESMDLNASILTYSTLSE